ncbi:hypothetical protein K435DRAFT_759884 [Dendrothele bispora CBS 962.96]|uniref:RING-type E3 ubiquitin transferase n=1 Tax=Dendrothele bispora (strain CBS 962.96) TaxID=1314807 RepID=A0A4S8LPK0_DENBC|nr:hypothetical protein K435DRAFT_759884 [Dendrothele bispora CBS 962.96]
MSRSTGLPIFPDAQQAQIIRAHQRDLYHVSSLREQTENVLRSWLGTRWLTRWDKEFELVVNLVYYGLTTGRAIQTLGEEYTDIWQYSAFTRQVPPSGWSRVVLVLLPTLPSYILARFVNTASLALRNPRLAAVLKNLPRVLQLVSELNLASFYIRGVYYDMNKRMLGIRHLSSIPPNPHTRPPSYSLLGVLIIIRLLYRLTSFIRETREAARISDKSKNKEMDLSTLHETYLDDRPVSELLQIDPENEPPKPAEEDEGTMLDVESISQAIRASRSCTLCLEERTNSVSTECGHLFCWSCIVGWGREKPECPLCRQSLNLTRLLPIYNL